MERLFYCNGIDAETGEYLSSPLTAEEIAQRTRKPRPDDLSDLKLRLKTDDEVARGLREGLDSRDLAQAGWGVVFLDEDEGADAIRKALQPLLDLRRSQAGRLREHYYQEYQGSRGLKASDTKSRFLTRYGVSPGPADPEDLPYYLLLVGDPAKISYQLQYQLDIEYAVGRLYFETLPEYERYAQSVVAAEREGLSRPRQATFFGAQNANDPLTEESATRLTQPLAAELEKNLPEGWKVRSILGSEASKKQLQQLIGGDETPALLFTAGHGIGCAKDNPLQRERQGALLCSDWPGKGHGASTDMYFTGGDVADEARLSGLISFHFACYSAGMPTMDEFAHRNRALDRTEIAESPFVSRLSQRLLAHPAGGSLAMIGHIDRCFVAAPRVKVFRDVFTRLMNGYPVGAAVEPLNQLHAALSAELVPWLEGEVIDKVKPESRTEAELAEQVELWTANHDAKSWAIVGDPAVRVPGTWKGGA